MIRRIHLRPTPWRGARWVVAAISVLGVSLSPGRAVRGATLVLGAARDNTLYQSLTGDVSNGAGSNFFAGRTNGSAIHRGLIGFDVAGQVPAGAVITAAELRLRMSRTTAGTTPVSLYALTADWGEGTSNAAANEGQGAPATPGSATWLHTFFSTSLWASSGGDFNPTASATLNVGGVGTYTWSSTSGLVADVQRWLDQPALNFGWLIRGDESVDHTSKRFDSRENATAANRPQLTITYELPPLVGDANGDGEVGAADYALWAAQFGESGGDLSADFDHNGNVGAGDYALWAANFGHLRTQASVPEPNELAWGFFAVIAWAAQRRGRVPVASSGVSRQSVAL